MGKPAKKGLVTVSDDTGGSSPPSRARKEAAASHVVTIRPGLELCADSRNLILIVKGQPTTYYPTDAWSWLLRSLAAIAREEHWGKLPTADLQGLIRAEQETAATVGRWARIITDMKGEGNQEQ